MTKPIVIVTSTFYKSTEVIRFHLACEMVRKAIEAGHTVVVVDDSPNPEVPAKLVRLGATVFPQIRTGMGHGRRQAFFHAVEVGLESGINHFLWNEPEKVGLIRSIPDIQRALIDGTNIVIAKRSPESWKTWPAFQVEREQRANKVYNELFAGFFTFEDDEFDPMFGPVAFNLDVATHFVHCHPGILMPREEYPIQDTYICHYAPILAKGREDWIRVKSVEVNMTYPPEQRSEEEGPANAEMLAKRERQLSTLTQAYQNLFRFVTSVRRED